MFFFLLLFFFFFFFFFVEKYENYEDFAVEKTALSGAMTYEIDHRIHSKCILGKIHCLRKESLA